MTSLSRDFFALQLESLDLTEQEVRVKPSYWMMLNALEKN